MDWKIPSLLGKPFPLLRTFPSFELSQSFNRHQDRHQEGNDLGTVGKRNSDGSTPAQTRGISLQADTSRLVHLVDLVLDLSKLVLLGTADEK